MVEISSFEVGTAGCEVDGIVEPRVCGFCNASSFSIGPPLGASSGVGGMTLTRTRSRSPVPCQPRPSVHCELIEAKKRVVAFGDEFRPE